MYAFSPGSTLGQGTSVPGLQEGIDGFNRWIDDPKVSPELKEHFKEYGEKGAAIGSVLGPIGTGIGFIIGTGVGFITAGLNPDAYTKEGRGEALLVVYPDGSTGGLSLVPNTDGKGCKSGTFTGSVEVESTLYDKFVYCLGPDIYNIAGPGFSKAPEGTLVYGPRGELIPPPGSRIVWFPKDSVKKVLTAAAARSLRAGQRSSAASASTGGSLVPALLILGVVGAIFYGTVNLKKTSS